MKGSNMDISIYLFIYLFGC